MAVYRPYKETVIKTKPSRQPLQQNESENSNCLTSRNSKSKSKNKFTFQEVSVQMTTSARTSHQQISCRCFPANSHRWNTKSNLKFVVNHGKFRFYNNNWSSKQTQVAFHHIANTSHISNVLNAEIRQQQVCMERQLTALIRTTQD